jgi:glycosyltransferase involved in cell wall biosynthesis
MSLANTLIDTFRVFTITRTLERDTGAQHVYRPSTAPDKTRHLALFAWALPPSTTGGVYRPHSFIKYGSRRGWKISAFHGPITRQSQNKSLAIPESATLHLVKPSPLRPSYRFSPQIDGDFTNAIQLARQAIKTLENSPPDLILASGPPFHVFVAGRYVARYFGVPLVLDYRDEWSECPFDFVSKSRDNRKWERRCIRAADAVIFTTQSHIEHQLKIFSEFDRSKVHLIPNGWDEEDFNAAQCSPFSTQEKSRREMYTLSHIGTLGWHSLPHDFLQQLAEIFRCFPDMRKRLRIQFIGVRIQEAETAIKDFPFQDNLHIVDHVDKQAANRLMMESDALLLIYPHGFERYRPGRLFDYVAARRPILVHGVKGEATQVVDQLGIGLHAGNTDELHRALTAFLSSPPRQASEEVSTWLHQHRRDMAAEKLFCLLEYSVSQDICRSEGQASNSIGA